ncbi:hypothetical protein PS1_034717 [Malus domestica]
MAKWLNPDDVLDTRGWGDFDIIKYQGPNHKTTMMPQPSGTFSWRWPKVLLEKGNLASTSAGSLCYAGMWGKLWVENVPPKVKIGVWRIYKDIIPTKADMVRKQGTDSSCTLCFGLSESALHILRDCCFASCT